MCAVSLGCGSDIPMFCGSCTAHDGVMVCAVLFWCGVYMPTGLSKICGNSSSHCSSLILVSRLYKANSAQYLLVVWFSIYFLHVDIPLNAASSSDILNAADTLMCLIYVMLGLWYTDVVRDIWVRCDIFLFTCSTSIRFNQLRPSFSPLVCCSSDLEPRTDSLSPPTTACVLHFYRDFSRFFLRRLASNCASRLKCPPQKKNGKYAINKSLWVRQYHIVFCCSYAAVVVYYTVRDTLMWYCMYHIMCLVYDVYHTSVVWTKI